MNVWRSVETAYCERNSMSNAMIIIYEIMTVVLRNVKMKKVLLVITKTLIQANA
jgi:hypothetical protein